MPARELPLVRSARRETQDVERSRPFRWLVRTGFVARGVTYGVVGGLALALALGAGTDGAAADQQGALALIARFSLGALALCVIAAGLLAYALWKLGQAIMGWGPEQGREHSIKDRISALGGGVVYIGFFAVAIRVIAGGGGNSRSAPRHATAGVLGWPGGQALVAIAGAILIATSLYQVWEAVTGRFAGDSEIDRMGAEERRVFMAIGRVGLAARAIVFALVGYFVLRAAIDFKPSSAVSLDGALARVHHQPLGPWLLAVVAVGLLTFAAFSFFEARYRRL